MCAVANGGCQQLCLYRGGGQRACACAHGMLAEDGASCREYAGYLLYSERTILKSIHLSDERNLNAPVQAFEDPKHMKNVIALAFDYRAGTSPGTPNRIFFSDIHFGNIQQINDDGSGRTTIVESEPGFQIFQGSGVGGGGMCREGRHRLRVEELAGLSQAPRPARPPPIPPASESLTGGPWITLCRCSYWNVSPSLRLSCLPSHCPLVLVCPQAAQIAPAPLCVSGAHRFTPRHRISVTWGRSLCSPSLRLPVCVETGAQRRPV